MSLRGEIEAKCPHGCPPFETEIWSFIRGDRDPELRETLIAGELNLLLCPNCGRPFFPEEAYVYYEPAAELLAFVFPESFRKEEAQWRRKMHEDFAAMRQALGEGLPASLEPQLFFAGPELAELLEREDYRNEECQVMESWAKELGLSLYRVSPRFAREHGIPAVLPAAGDGGKATRESVLSGLKTLLAANDRLTSFARFRDALASDPQAPLPPRQKS